MRMIVGGYTSDMGGNATGVRSAQVVLDDFRGIGLTDESLLPLRSPSYLIAHPDRPWLFAVTEGPSSTVHSLRMAEGGELSLLSSQSTGGEAACHLGLSPDGQHLLVANYGSGSISSFAVAADGRLTPRLDLMTFSGHGPDPDRQASPHAHQVVFDDTELLISDLGTDRIHRLRLAPDGRLSPAHDPITLPPGSGPRHLLRIGDYLVVACELSGTLWLGAQAGDQWSERQVVSCSPSGIDPGLEPSALRVFGERVYVANRGPGTIAAFDLDASVGQLVPIAEFDCGPRPRDMILEPGGGRIWAANQSTDRITVLDSRTLPAQIIGQIASPTPTCIVLNAIP